MKRRTFLKLSLAAGTATIVPLRFLAADQAIAVTNKERLYGVLEIVGMEPGSTWWVGQIWDDKTKTLGVGKTRAGSVRIAVPFDTEVTVRVRKACEGRYLRPFEVKAIADQPINKIASIVTEDRCGFSFVKEGRARAGDTLADVVTFGVVE